MAIDWNHFTPWTALGGGLLLGVAAALLVLLHGRVLGISGIMGGLLRPARADLAWRLTFLLGMLCAPLVYRVRAGPFTATVDAGWGTLVLAGILVGIGTRYGAGCTSGHGVCGLSRRSPRSMVATLAFMAAGFVTVFVMRHGVAG